MDLGAARAHPAFAPYGRWLADGRLPDIATLNAWARARPLALPDGRTLRFADADVRGALAYETSVAEEAVVPTRAGSTHDVQNALAWLAFPRTKTALNAVHLRAGAAATANRRDRARDAATLLDESGLLLACADPTLVSLLRAHRWRDLFVARAADVAQDMRPFVLGHGLLEKLSAPYRAITARVLVVPLSVEDSPDAIDAAAAQAIASERLRPEALLPLPVAALPGWDTEHLGERLFDDASVFRPMAS
jgi:hypothetical protein